MDSAAGARASSTQKRVFKDIHGYGSPYVYIHPYKQKDVYEVIQNAKKYDWIEYIIIFGSSVSLVCKDTSDVDVCIIGEKPKNFSVDILRDIEKRFDFLCFESSEDIKSEALKNKYSLEARIYESGVIVYDRVNRLT